MSAKDETLESQDLKARLTALVDPGPEIVPPVKTENRNRRGSPKPGLQPSSDKTPKALYHSMYVSSDEDLFFKHLIGKFIVATGQTIGASEALRVMMFATAEVSDEQLREAYERARSWGSKESGNPRFCRRSRTLTPKSSPKWSCNTAIRHGPLTPIELLS